MTLHSISAAIIREVLRWVTKHKGKAEVVEARFHKVTFWSTGHVQVSSLEVSFLPQEHGCQGTSPVVSLFLASFTWEKPLRSCRKGKRSYRLTGRGISPWEAVPPRGSEMHLWDQLLLHALGQMNQKSVDALSLASCWTIPATPYTTNLRKIPECQKASVKNYIMKLLDVARTTGDGLNRTFPCVCEL